MELFAKQCFCFVLIPMVMGGTINSYSDNMIEKFESLVKIVERLEIRFNSQEAIIRKFLEKFPDEVVRNDFKINQNEIIKEFPLNNSPDNHPIPVPVRSNNNNGIFYPRTCQEALSFNPEMKPGMYWIDPDGQGIGDEPIYVFCDVTSGLTSVAHNSEWGIQVDHCLDPGCYSRPIRYNSTMRQIISLIELSNECHQSIRYDCFVAPFEFNNIEYSWWTDRYNQPQYFWAGSNNSIHTCQCGIDQNCVDVNLFCNCDASAPVELYDLGIISGKDYLPITTINFGRTLAPSSSGIHTVGRLECSGKADLHHEMPTSCVDLWKMGHLLSGIYQIKGSKQIETVFCDMSKLITDSGIQTDIGYSNVRSSPVYFYVQRITSLAATNTVFYEVEVLNIGRAMNMATGIFTAPKSGLYQFIFTGTKSSDNENTDVFLLLNGEKVAIGVGGGKNDISAIAMQSLLHLNVDDEVKMVVTKGALLSPNHDTQFSGWLMEQDV